MDLDRCILVLLQQFGFSDVDENALMLLRQIGKSYLDLCARKSSVQPTILKNLQSNLTLHALPHAGLTPSGLLQYGKHFEYMSELQQPFQAQETVYLEVPQSKIFTGDMTEKLEE